MTHMTLFHRPPGIWSRLAMMWLAGLVSTLAAPPHISQAQVPPITPSGLNTQISAPITVPGGTQYTITGGTRPGAGPNLFHSFGQFGVPTATIANFLNETALPTANILGRVTGGSPSNLFGTIQTSGFGSANLFLMNPAGILFGPTATVNIGGMATFTTADSLRLADGTVFHAAPNAAADALLSVAPVASFGFLGPRAGPITVDHSTLQMPEGKGLALVGDAISIVGGD
jgi:filamentous hemagglutinin family protein